MALIICVGILTAANELVPPAPVPRAGLPDFQVVGATISAGRLTFAIINRGDATWPAGQTFDYTVLLPGQQAFRQTFRLPSDLAPIPYGDLVRGPPYPPADQMQVEVDNLVIPCGIRNLTITINPDNLVPELDYANNRFYNEYVGTPPGSCGPRLKLYSAQSVSLPSPTSSYWLARLWIKNLGNAPVSQIEIAVHVFGVRYASPGSWGVPPNFNYRIISTKDYPPMIVQVSLQPGEMRLVDVYSPVTDLPSGFPSCAIVAAQIVGVPGAYPQPPIELPHLVWVLPSEWNGRSGDGGVIPDTFPNAPGCVGILPPGPVAAPSP